MKSWLDNITNEQIEQFIQTKKQCDRIIITRDRDIIKVVAIQTSNNEEYEDKEYTFCYNAYGEGYMYRGDLVLHPFGEDTKKWFELVYKANIDIQIDGLTYCEAFEQAHEKAIINNHNLKNMLIQQEIDKLTLKKNENSNRLKSDLEELHSKVNKMRKGNSEIKRNLIVKGFLNRMSN